jgi:hypothetical protein
MINIAGASWSPSNGMVDEDLVVTETWKGGRATAVTTGLTIWR